MWANLHLLFWLSLFPFVTGWMGENHFSPLPSALYGAVLLLAAIAYVILQTLIVAEAGPDSHLARALGADWKGKLSAILYAIAIGLSFVSPIFAGCIYLGVALMVTRRRGPRSRDRTFISSARRRTEHARRVRSPELPRASCEKIPQP